jgi:cytochrome b561
VTAAMLLVIIGAGLWISYFPPADQAFKMRLYNVHESFGVIVFFLALARIAYRRRHPPPPLPPDTPRLIHLCAHATHVALYALLLLMPVIGFLSTNAWGFPLSLFGVLPLPSPIGKDEALAQWLKLFHWGGAITIILLICGHLGGVVYHTFIRRDGLLKRMT